MSSNILNVEFKTRASYQEALRKQAVLDVLEMAIRNAYAVLGPDEANGTVQWTHANVHTEYVRKP